MGIMVVDIDSVNEAYNSSLTQIQHVILDELVLETDKKLIEAAQDGYPRVTFKSVRKQAPKIRKAWLRIMRDRGFEIYVSRDNPVYYFIEIHKE